MTTIFYPPVTTTTSQATMGTKRSHTDMSDPQQHQRHRKAPRHGQDTPHSKPRHRPAPSPNPLNPLKARLRSLRRLLAHDDALDTARPTGTAQIHPERAALLAPGDELEIAEKRARRDGERGPKRMPANVRAERERELRKLEVELEEAEGKKRRSDIISRWHKVRFFERRKAERRLGKVKKGGGEGWEEQVDLNYAMYWPLEREYVPLWPRRKDGEEEEGRKGDGEMWRLVESCMREGRLEDLREGRVEGCGVEKVVRKEEKVEKKEKKREKKVAVEEDEDSDGGFFE